MRKLNAARRCRMLHERLRQLVDQPQRRPITRQQRGQLRDGIDHKIHQIHKEYDPACRDPPAGQRHVRPHQKHAQLCDHARDGADYAHQRPQAAAMEFFALQRAVAFGEQAQYLALRAEGLDHGKAAQAIRQCGGEALVRIRDATLGRLYPFARQQGRRKGQQRQPHGDRRHQRRAAQHHHQRAHKCDRHGDHRKLLRQIICLDARGVVGQRGQIYGSSARPERTKCAFPAAFRTQNPDIGAARARQIAALRRISAGKAQRRLARSQG